MRTNLPRAMRALRHRRGWVQADLGRRAGLSRDVAQRAETGKLRGITVGSLDALVGALDADLVIEVRWRGAELDALIDRAHAALLAAAADRLQRSAWTVHAEVSFNHYGDRGRCDLVAWHPRSRTLLIVEGKARIGNMQQMLGGLDVKVRLGTVIAQELGLGRPAQVIGALVLQEHGANRRQVRHYEALLRTFGIRGRPAFRWLRDPDPRASRPGIRLLWFESPRAAASGTKHRTDTFRRPAAG